ncbi:FAD/NAD(P)-binding protein [Serratia sp. NPDC078593]|uniref:FAD/NAD(P)-binding protein n=1 Tax=unclassified Serratia (in: enterobacteria) TaxID=2647522 RepID=UPI0037D2B1A3
MENRVIAIVGGGPRSVYALERLLALLRTTPVSATLTIHVFEACGRSGAGQAHSDEQPYSSYLNRCVDQISFAADESVQAANVLLPPSLRLTFYQWCRQRLLKTGDPRFDVAGHDVPRRYLHGLALRDRFDLYAALLSALPGITVLTHHDEVTSVRRISNGFQLFTLHGLDLAANHVLFVTGHMPCRPRPGSMEARFSRSRSYIDYAYPLEARFSARTVRPSSRLALLGMGLTAIDICLYLTEGRGGRFVADAAGSLCYHASGHEPAQIVALSPSGKMYSTRPINAKVLPEHFHRPQFFSERAVAQLRVHHGHSVMSPDGVFQQQLDFRQDIFPLIVLEMAWLYYCTLLGEGWGQRALASVMPAYQHFLSPAAQHHDNGVIDRLLQPLQQQFEQVTAELEALLATQTPYHPQLSAVASAFYRTLTDEIVEPQQALARLRDLTFSQVKWLHPLRLVDHRFDWQRIFEPFAGQAVRGTRQRKRQVLRWLEKDLAAARQGNLHNPLKAACDGVWRDLRPVFSAVTDFAGLNPASQREFTTHWLSYYNRLSNGAGVEAMDKMAALIRQGRVIVAPAGLRIRTDRAGKGFTLTGGGRRMTVERLACARLHPFHARYQRQPLYPGMLRSGLIHLWCNRNGQDAFVPGAVALNPAYHPVAPDGTVEERLTFLGSPVEGVRFFQNAAARPGANSAALNAAHQWAAQILHEMAAQPVSLQEVSPV